MANHSDILSPSHPGESVSCHEDTEPYNKSSSVKMSDNESSINGVDNKLFGSDENESIFKKSSDRFNVINESGY